jgi:hypothetical protein
MSRWDCSGLQEPASSLVKSLAERGHAREAYQAVEQWKRWVVVKHNQQQHDDHSQQIADNLFAQCNTVQCQLTNAMDVDRTRLNDVFWSTLRHIPKHVFDQDDPKQHQSTAITTTEEACEQATNHYQYTTAIDNM